MVTNFYTQITNKFTIFKAKNSKLTHKELDVLQRFRSFELLLERSKRRACVIIKHQNLIKVENLKWQQHIATILGNDIIKKWANCGHRITPNNCLYLTEKLIQTNVKRTFWELVILKEDGVPSAEKSLSNIIKFYTVNYFEKTLNISISNVLGKEFLLQCE